LLFISFCDSAIKAAQENMTVKEIELILKEQSLR